MNSVEVHESPEELLRDLAVAIPTALSYAQKGRLLWVSEAMSHMFGHESVVGVVGMHAREFYHSQQEYERVRKIVRASLKQGRPAELAARFKRRDGTSFSGYLRATGLLRGGQERGVISTIGDASAKAEKRTTDSEPEDTYRGLFTLSPDAIVVSSRAGKILEANPAFLDLLGYDPEEIREIHAKSLWANPDERASWQEQMERDGFAKEFEARLITKDGRVKVCLLTSVVRLDRYGEVRYQTICRDVSERERAEEALRLSEVTYREIFNTVNDTIWIHDIETFKFLDVNNRVAEMFGYSVGEALDLSVEEISSGVPPFTQETAAESLKKAAAGEPQLFEWHTRHKDGRLFWTEVSLKRGTVAGKECLLAIERDITDRKLAEAEREKLQEQLLHAQKMDSVGRLAGGVAHDFNNMLSAILGHVEMAIVRCAPSDPIYARLNVIKESALRSAELVRQLLAFARRQTVAPKVLDLNDTVASLLNMLLRLMGEDIDLLWMPGARLWPVKIDPSQVDQIFANLCINARDAITGVGKLTIETENTSFDEAYCASHADFICGDYVMLAVSDDGCGMSREVLDHLFEPFFTTKEMGKGTGLGLATVYGIVKQNEGFINVYSEPDKGTTFRIYLPRFVGEVRGSTAEFRPETPTGHGETVLLVEDDAVTLNVSREMLEQLGYKALTAETPSEALRQAREHAAEIQLLITDVVMPEMNGRDLAKLIIDIKPGLKCLFTSGYTANVIAHHGVLYEDVQFLQKPFSLHELGVEVRKALERE